MTYFRLYSQKTYVDVYLYYGLHDGFFVCSPAKHKLVCYPTLHVLQISHSQDIEHAFLPSAIGYMWDMYSILDWFPTTCQNSMAGNLHSSCCSQVTDNKRKVPLLELSVSDFLIQPCCNEIMHIAQAAIKTSTEGMSLDNNKSRKHFK